MLYPFGGIITFICRRSTPTRAWHQDRCGNVDETITKLIVLSHEHRVQKSKQDISIKPISGLCIEPHWSKWGTNWSMYSVRWIFKMSSRPWMFWKSYWRWDEMVKILISGIYLKFTYSIQVIEKYAVVRISLPK